MILRMEGKNSDPFNLSNYMALYAHSGGLCIKSIKLIQIMPPELNPLSSILGFLSRHADGALHSIITLDTRPKCY